MTTLRLLLIGAVLTAPISLPSAVLANGKQKCPPNSNTVIETKQCPGGFVVQRACCTNPKGKVRCKAFPKCPKKSPS